MPDASCAANFKNIARILTRQDATFERLIRLGDRVADVQGEHDARLGRMERMMNALEKKLG